MVVLCLGEWPGLLPRAPVHLSITVYHAPGTVIVVLLSCKMLTYVVSGTSLLFERMAEGLDYRLGAELFDTMGDERWLNLRKANG